MEFEDCSRSTHFVGQCCDAQLFAAHPSVAYNFEAVRAGAGSAAAYVVGVRQWGAEPPAASWSDVVLRSTAALRATMSAAAANDSVAAGGFPTAEFSLLLSRFPSLINITTETLDTDSAATATAEGATTTTATTTSDDNETQGPILIKKLFLPSLTIQ